MKKTKPLLLCLTGGPSSGKTAVARKAEELFSDRIVVVHERATILLQDNPPNPWTPEWRCKFQDAVFQAQRDAEAEALARAGAMGRVAVLVDRGILDGAAYLPGELVEFAARFGVDVLAEMLRYYAIIRVQSLACVRPEAYGRDGNAERFEAAAEAERLDAAIGRVWAGHPRLVSIPVMETLDQKVEAALTVIQNLIKE